MKPLNQSLLEREIRIALSAKRIGNIEISGYRANQYPEFEDAYLTYAEIDGEAMTEEELDILSELAPELVTEHAVFQYQMKNNL